MISPADFDESGFVDFFDMTLWQYGFGTPTDATHLQGDANGDRAVDGTDFLIWQRQLSPNEVITATATPEPAGSVLASVARAQDIAARVGGDEFLLLAVECDRSGAATLADRLRADFAFAGVNASIGYALRDPARGLKAAWDEADKAMYVEKSHH